MSIFIPIQAKYGTALVLIVVKAHPTRRFPSISSFRTWTVLLAFGLNVVSRTQAALTLAMRFRATAVTVVKAQPNMRELSERGRRE